VPRQSMPSLLVHNLTPNNVFVKRFKLIENSYREYIHIKDFIINNQGIYIIINEIPGH
jgi:hypothetical protein